jgi:hypothetical protein
MPTLATLRFHDLRHTAITTLAEGQNSDSTVMALAGHVSRQMMEHYSHIRMDAKRRAVEGLSLSKLLPVNATEGGAGGLTAQSTSQKLLSAGNDAAN